MAYESNLQLTTLPGTTGLSQFQAVIVNSAGRAAKPASTAGIAVVGVTQNASTAMGYVVSGSSGAADRIITVALSPIGTT